MNFQNFYITLDTETGGLKASDNPVLEIAICVMNHNLEDVFEYNKLIVPYGNYSIQEQAFKANGLNVKLLEDKGEDVSVVCNEMIEILTKYKKGRNKPVICGHNIKKFDFLFLQEMFRFCKKDFLSYINEDFYIDTMWWSRARWLESTNYKLHTCCDNAGIELVDAHRALPDTKANKDLVKYLITNLRSEKNTEENVSRYRDGFEF
jgi:DNA polymerase III alpha subunit (gram-positive type)